MRDLERELRELAASVVFPDVPDLAGPVGERLRARPARRPLPRLVLALATLLAAAVVGLAVPPARSALLELLRIGGVEVERVETRPDLPAVRDPALGEPVTAAEARRAASFPVLVPAVPAARAYVDRSVPGTRVSFAWRERGQRLVLTQFRGEQLPFLRKVVGPDTRVELVRIGLAEGAWLEGAPHEVVWRDAEGEIRHETRRAAGNVLLWERDGVTFRLEGARSRVHALGIARALIRR